MGNLPSTCWFDRYFLGGFCPTAVAVAVAKHLAVWDATAGSYGKLNEPVQLEVGETVEYIGQMQGGKYSRFLLDGKDDSEGRLYCYMDSANKSLNFTNFVIATLDGVSITSAAVSITDNFIHTLRLTTSTSAHVGYIGARFSMISPIDQTILAVNVYKADGTPKHKFNFLSLLSDQRSVLDSTRGGKLRWVYNFNGVDSHIDTSAANILLTTDDTITLDFIYNGQTSDFLFFTGSTTNWLTSCICGVISGNWQLTSGKNVTLNGQPVTQGSAANIPLGFNALSWTRNGATPANLTRIGSEFDRRFVSFPIFNFKINDGSVYNYPINDRTFGVGAVIANTATVLGDELFVNPTINSYWTDNGDGSYTINAPNGVFNSLSVPPTGLVNGDTILIQFEVVSISGVDSVSAHLSGQQVRSNGKIGTFKGLIAYGGTGELHFARGSGSGAFTSTIRNISIKKANGYAKGVNLLESGWKQVPEKPDTKYVELVNFAQSQIRPYIESVPYYGYIYQDMGVKQRPAYKFDGTAYAKLRHPRKVFAGQTVSFTFQIDDIADIADRFWLDATDGLLRATVQTDGNWNPFGTADDKTFIDGVEVAHGSNLTPYADGLPHVLTMTTKQDCTLEYVASNRSGGQQGKGYLFDLKVDDELVLPVDDGVGNVLRNVGFGLDADIISHNPDNWNFLPKYRDNYITRNIVELDNSVAGGKVRTSQITILPTDDFKLTVKLMGSVGGTDTYRHIIESDSAYFRLRRHVYVENGNAWEHGSYACEMATVNPTTSEVDSRYLALLAENQVPTFPESVRELVITRVGDKATFLVDGVQQSTSTKKAGFDWRTVTFTELLRLDAFPLEFELEVNGVKTHYYDFNIPKGETLVPNLCEPKGSELITNGDFNEGSTGWFTQSGMTFEGGKLHYNGTTNNVLYQNVNLELGESYLFEIDIANVVRNGGNQPRVKFSGSPDYLPIKALTDGVYQVALVSPSTGSTTLYIELGAFGHGAEFDVNYVSLKKITSWAELINVPAESNKTYTWSDEHESWVSENLAPYTEVTIPMLALEYNYPDENIRDQPEKGKWLLSATLQSTTNVGVHQGWSSSMTGVGAIGSSFRPSGKTPPYTVGGIVDCTGGLSIRLYSNNAETTYTDISVQYLLPKA